MSQELKTINLGGVNCYLIKTSTGGYVLIDTGISSKRPDLVKELERAGCKPGNFELVILTHGDIDHVGSCAYLQEQYGANIALHPGDSGMVEKCDMNWNRKAKADKISFLGNLIILSGRIAPFFGAPGKFETFRADIWLEDGQDLSEYGFTAKIIHLPGHSKGSIGILIDGGDPAIGSGKTLICGDLFINVFKPGIHFMINDLADFNASLEKLKGLNVDMVYPGHGKPFPLKQLVDDR